MCMMPADPSSAPDHHPAMTAASPFAPASFPDLPAIAGVRLAVAETGIRYRGRTDLLLAELAEGTSVAGVFTRSQTAAAPVLWCRRALPPAGRGRWSSTPATPTPSPTGRRARVGDDRRRRRRAPGLPGRGGVRRLDRRDRRGPGDREAGRRPARRGGDARPGGLGAGGARHRHHRYFCEGRRGDGGRRQTCRCTSPASSRAPA